MRVNLEFKINKETNEIIETKGLENLFEMLRQGYELRLIKPAEEEKIRITIELAI